VHASLLGLAALLALFWGAFAASRHAPSDTRTQTPVSTAPTTQPLPAQLDAPFDELEQAVRP
jgi:hypothetical protein